MVLEFQNKTNTEIIRFLLMHFRFALDLPDIYLWNIDLLDTHLDLLDADVPRKYFVFLHNVFKTSSRNFFKTSSAHVFKRSSIRVFQTSSRRLEDVFKTSLQDIFRMTLRGLQDVFKTCLPNFFKTSSRPTSV